MKPSVKPQTDELSVAVVTSPRRSVDWFIWASMVAYSVLAFGAVGSSGGGVFALSANALAYFLCMFVFYGIARLVYREQTWLLLSGVMASLVIPFLLSGIPSLWLLVTGWAMLLLAGMVTGRMTRAGYPPGWVYTAGAVIVTVLFAVQTWPVWNQALSSAETVVNSTLEQARQIMVSMGYGTEAIEGRLEQFRRFLDLIIRLFPAATVMAALIQFSVGYLLFVGWLHKIDPLCRGSVPFAGWKAPFGLTPVLLVAITARLLGGEFLRIAADNVMAVLAMYYCIAGLALMEFYLQRLSVSKAMKVVFYLLLFFTQLAGFLVMALVGFVDSFADWRNRRPAEERLSDK
ncbi:MAG: DUF2232 domain-containing protein [Candidatus Zixiibacteriota bacterium]